MWRSWIEASYLLKEGCSWHVGNGSRINVWGDRWVQDQKIRRLKSIKPPDCHIGKVKELMNNNQGGWNDNLLHQLFCQEDVQAIKSTPISLLGQGDRMKWPYTKTGQYTVSSGYNLARDLDRQKKGNEGSSTGREKEVEILWHRIWSLNIKKRVQHFLWRACHNRIAVGANLRKRGIKVDGLCSQCGEMPETVEHVLFHCPTAQLIWKLAPVQWDGLSSLTGSLKEWWRKQGEIGKTGALEDRQELTAYLMWQIWKARNRWLYNSEPMIASEIVHKAWNEWMSFKSEQKFPADACSRPVLVERRTPWKPPNLDTIKLNVSSDIAADALSFGLGAVARDGEGVLQQAWSVVREASAIQWQPTWKQFAWLFWRRNKMVGQK